MQEWNNAKYSFLTTKSHFTFLSFLTNHIRQHLRQEIEHEEGYQDRFPSKENLIYYFLTLRLCRWRK